MSLHGKIVAWFIFFASLTVMLFVLGDYFQSSQALRVALEARGSALAGQASAEIERRYERAERELLALGYEVAGGAAIRPIQGEFTHVRVLRDDRLFRERAGTAEPPESETCAFGLVPFSVPFEDRAGHAYRVEAAMFAADFFAAVPALATRFGRGGITTVIDRTSGTVVFDNGCLLRSGAVAEELAAALTAAALESGPAGERSRSFAESGAGKGRLLALATPEAPLWTTAVVIDYDEFAAPFRSAHTQYLLLMVAVMVIALLFVLRMLRSDMRRLAALSAAADAIGHGRFDVWLPPPTGDEVGRLSLALGRMVNRLSSTLHQMEISRAMAAVGELATYLSHEIRNPLSSIRLNLQMLRRDLRSGTPPDDAPQLVALCLAELQRLDDVVRTVLEVGRKRQGSAQASCYVHDVVLDTIQVLHPKLHGHGVVVETSFTVSDAAVAIDPAQLKSVLINLLLNAVDAMAESETRRITISSELSDGPQAEPTLELRIMDTGPGIPAHLRDRIFEPFFTTKATGNGIGLATSLRIMQEAGGLLRCTPASEWAGGAEFVLELPLSHAGDAAPDFERPAPALAEA